MTGEIGNQDLGSDTAVYIPLAIWQNSTNAQHDSNYSLFNYRSSNGSSAEITRTQNRKRSKDETKSDDRENYKLIVKMSTQSPFPLKNLNFSLHPSKSTNYFVLRQTNMQICPYVFLSPRGTCSEALYEHLMIKFGLTQRKKNVFGRRTYKGMWEPFIDVWKLCWHSRSNRFYIVSWGLVSPYFSHLSPFHLFYEE